MAGHGSQDEERPTDDEFERQIDDLNELESIEARLGSLGPDAAEYQRVVEREADVRRRVDAWHRRFL